MKSQNNGSIKKLDGNRVLIIGLGQIGYSNAEYMTACGLQVDGFDIMDKAVERAIKDGVVRKKANDFSNYDYYIICISTHMPGSEFIPYLDGLYEIARRLSKEGKAGALVGIDSTVTKGTSKKILDLLGHKMHVVHTPHRFYIHEKEEHGVRQMRVIGGCEPCCLKEGIHLYHDLLGIPLHKVSDVKVAELTKIVENSHRFLEIAFAEELKMVCDNSGIDFDELREAVNTKWNTKILEARTGIDGHCLPKDSQMFLSISAGIIHFSIIDTAKKIDQLYRMHLLKSKMGDIAGLQVQALSRSD